MGTSVKGQGIAICQPQPEQPRQEGTENLLIGRSPAMREIAETVRQAAAYRNTTVLLQGESGTGKDVVAHAIHALSSRAYHQFVDINCAAIPDSLLETELFGVEAGAFTDAKVSRMGYLFRADRGTLFLDEIGSMSPVLQPKLLRVLETLSFRRVGGLEEMKVDLRVIAATNTDLFSAVKRRAFREDLYYRLNVFPIRIPPLRDRPEDIEPLVEHFLRILNVEEEVPLHMSQEAMELLLRYHWPGNVRELRSAIQRSQIVCDGNEILPKNLPEEIRKSGSSAAHRLDEAQQQLNLPPGNIDLLAFLGKIERRFVQQALERCNGNQVQAAALLGISRDQLRYRLART